MDDGQPRDRGWRNGAEYDNNEKVVGDPGRVSRRTIPWTNRLLRQPDAFSSRTVCRLRSSTRRRHQVLRFVFCRGEIQTSNARVNSNRSLRRSREFVHLRRKTGRRLSAYCLPATGSFAITTRIGHWATRPSSFWALVTINSPRRYCCSSRKRALGTSSMKRRVFSPSDKSTSCVGCSTPNRTTRKP